MNQPCATEEGHSIRGRFSAAAPSYHACARVQAQIADDLMELLSDRPQPYIILDIGCGTGLLTERILARYPEARIDALDFSPAMLASAASRLTASPNLRWIEADARHRDAGETYDLILSSSSLQWMEPVEETFNHIVGQLKPGGAFVFSLMLRETLPELDQSRRRVAPHKTGDARFRTRDDIEAIFKTLDGDLTTSADRLYRSAYPSARHFLEEIHQLGVTGGSVSRNGLPLNRTELSRLLTDYESHYAHPDGGVTAGFQAGFFQFTRNGT
ncbi:MAG: methyltransferase domain-containing protein [Verrucomicrobiota bacterium]